MSMSQAAENASGAQGRRGLVLSEKLQIQPSLGTPIQFASLVLFPASPTSGTRVWHKQ